jgi:isopenicillin N synthase-like dioxygenase
MQATYGGDDDDDDAIRDPILEFHKEVASLARAIGKLLSMSLHLDEAAFDGYFTRQTMGMNYYPKCPEPELAMGLSSHSDFGSISLLMQNAPGLQAINPLFFLFLSQDYIRAFVDSSINVGRIAQKKRVMKFRNYILTPTEIGNYKIFNARSYFSANN